MLKFTHRMSTVSNFFSKFRRVLSGMQIRKYRNVSADIVEGIVCQESEVPENGMKVCDIGADGDQVLLVKQNGVISAIGTKCTHYGAPLVTGALGNGRVRCPWHGACFNIKNGDIEDFPGLDSIPCYQVEIQSEGGVRVRAKKSELKSNKRMKEMSPRDTKNNTTFVIIGGGPAGQVCAEKLRQEGFTGQLILLTAEDVPPYDRVKLSKQPNVSIDQIQLRPIAFYKEHSIELMLSTRAVGIDPKEKVIKLEGNKTISYTSVFIATGSLARILDVPGIDLKNVFRLRSLSDATTINKILSTNSNVVIVGASFLGMELAASCFKVCSEGSVTVISRHAVPLYTSLGQEVGERIAKLFTDKGVNIRSNINVTEVIGDSDGSVTSVTLSDGTSLTADLIIFAVGITYATEFLRDSGINLNPNGTVPVNQFMETNCPGVFAGGDIAEAPVYAAGGEAKSIGHWGLAHYHGRIAALNMMSITTPLRSVPFFWSMLFGTSFRYAGFAPSYDDTVIGGDIEGLKFACYYCKDGKVLAVTTVGTDPIASRFAELIHDGGSLSKKAVTDNPLDWPNKI